MKLSDFYFDLPESSIAQYPGSRRDKSRLMVLDRSSGRREHHIVSELPALLEGGSLLVFNNSRVRKARLSGRAVPSGAEVEFLLLEKLGTAAGPPDGALWQVMVRRARRRRLGSRYAFAGNRDAEIVGEEGETKTLRFDQPIDDDWLDRYGHVPLPPYIKRGDNSLDSERYQTVYARETGSAAAPTAGLHFSPELFGALAKAGIGTAFITLHVGLGTFLPVRAEHIEDHRMHRENYTIGDEAAARVEKARAEGRKIVAVGTTSARALESAWLPAAPSDVPGPGEPPAGTLRRGEGSTSIFIYPGCRFNVVDQLFTNFHTPGSSLLMLVSAFAGNTAGAAGSPAETDTSIRTHTGLNLILESYAEAIRKGYRFFSYGDAMLIR
ncbi:MAG: tRNA preQ1(34) S-adenosylmethionine ribosyltransferase-isomerase QueA [Treponema sp.]|nr:tRNA preQ1(34) S-adenosylmethionine ribosyltransferase-isomerase QueA [Treponema sp.]